MNTDPDYTCPSYGLPTFSCHACGKVRCTNNIGVCKRELTDPSGIKLAVQLRFCRTSESCFDAVEKQAEEMLALFDEQTKTPCAHSGTCPIWFEKILSHCNLCARTTDLQKIGTRILCTKCYTEKP